MSIRVSLMALMFLMLLGSCEPQMTDDSIPWLPFPEVVLDLSFPVNQSLRVDGGLLEIDNAGVRGIIVYRVSGNTFRAYERNCSFQPNEAGATVNIHSSNLYLIDHSCGSSFSLADGIPSGGPAWRPLRQYRTVFANNTVTITDESVN
jgi:nitrite reductase/ring-hydroxylating ferredoxin subunit